MRLTAILLVSAGLTANATGHSQTVTLDLKDVPIQQVFREVIRQTGTSIVYNEEIFKNAAPVTIKVINATVPQVLSLCLDGQPYSYEIIDKTIVIEARKDAMRVIDPDEPLPAIDVNGIVLNESGQPIAGVTVIIKGTRQATSTDANGEFTLVGVDRNAILVFSATNIETSEVPLHGRTNLRLTFKTKVSPLDEVQIIAYGTNTQRYNTGNVSTVTSKEIEQQPVANSLLALQGRVPGLFITQATGVTGSAVKVQIRGQNSIGNGNDPLYIVDGVPYPSQLISLGSSGGIRGSSGTGNGSPFSFINPSDIESISVLKDADATAIYGSRGANGVILVTTKRGKAGDTKVDINVQKGYGKVTRRAPLLNLQQYLEMRHEALKNDGITPSLEHGDYDLLLWDTTRSTDWQKVLIGNIAHYMDIQTSASGGNDYTQFLIGAGYHRETNVFPDDFANENASLHFNINNYSKNKKFQTSLTGNFMIDNNRLPSFDLTGSALSFAPDAPALYNKDGSLNWEPNSSGSSTFGNPLADLTRDYHNKTNNFIVNGVLSYEFIPGLTLRSNFGYTYMKYDEFSPEPLTSYPPERRATATRYAIYNDNSLNSWIIEPQLSYKKKIGSGLLQALIGSTIDQNNTYAQSLLGAGYNTDAVIKDLQSASIIYAFGSVQSLYRYNALFGRLNYNLKNEILLDLTARRDGSSRFGHNNEFHDFAAAGLGWIFSNQSFFKNHLPFLSYGKIRASYGTTGNDQIGDYQYLSLYSPTSVFTAYQGQTGLNTYSPSNPDLQWELTKKAEIGLETGFFNDRILFTTSYSRNRSSNQLLSQSLPYFTGYFGVTENFPATVQNTTWEFTLKTTNIDTKNFKWTTNINLTIPQNKLIAFPGLDSSGYVNYLFLGKPIGLTTGFHLEGVDPKTGNYIFKSTTDPFNPNFTDDIFDAYINTLPKLYGGISNSVSYKDFSLDFTFQFVKQIGRNAFYGNPGQAATNQYIYVLNRWQKPGDIAPIAKYSTVSSFYPSISDAAFSDASYIRLKNLSFSWHVKDSWLRSIHMQNARLYVQGQNLLTITDYKGLDPENMGSGLPPLRVMTFGIEIGL